MAVERVPNSGRDRNSFGTRTLPPVGVAVCPGNHQSAGKRKSAKTRKGNRGLRVALVEADWAAARSQEIYRAALYRRLLPCQGEKRTLMAVAHSILVAAYQMLKNGQPYKELGPDSFDRLRPRQPVNRMVQRIRSLGYDVTLTPISAA